MDKNKVLEYTKPAEVIGDLGEIKTERLRMTSTADGRRQTAKIASAFELFSSNP